MRRCILLFAAFLLLPVQPSAVAAQENPIVFLVRHAERADDGDGAQRMASDPQMAMMVDDPPLSAAGETRASLLAEMLRDAGITKVHSTDYNRTIQTGEPTAQGLGLSVVLYDASDLEGFAKTLRSSPGRHLVVGHSNTTPNLVQALGGDPGTPIESMEYDRLYMVTFQGNEVRTVLLRFGHRFEGAPSDLD